MQDRCLMHGIRRLSLQRRPPGRVDAIQLYPVLLPAEIATHAGVRSQPAWTFDRFFVLAPV